MKSILTLLSACYLLGPLGANVNAAEVPPTDTNNTQHSNVRFKPGKGLTFTSDDKNFKTGLSGWLQADAAFYNSDDTPLTDGTRIRRGRVAFSAQLYHDFSARAEYDFVDKKNLDNRGFQDVYLRYTGIRHTALMLGNLKEPIGLEWQTSSKNTTFMERALSTALLPGYHMGFSASTHGKAWTATAGLFGDRFYDGISEGNGWSTGGRATFAPLHDNNNLTLHFGVSGNYRERGLQSPNLSYSSRPEANVANVRFSNTHSIRHVTDNKLMGLEFAALRGPFSIQSEYQRSFANRDNGRDDLQFAGWYTYGSWFITGESRKYSAKSGKFGHIKPKHKVDLHGGLGAIEVAVRYSEVDFNDKTIIGGHQSDVTLGVNWYLNSYMRLMGNYVFVQTDNNALGISNGGSEQPQVFELRAQIEL